MSVRTDVTASVPRSSMDQRALGAALQDANIPTLVMVLFQLTGDEAWLAPPFRPSRTRGLEDNATGGLSDERQQQLRKAAAQAILGWARGAPTAIPTPDVARMQVMMDVCMGEPVSPGYAEMMRVELGFDPDERGVAYLAPLNSTHRTDHGEPPVVVIGAGVAGISAARLLDQAQIPFVVLDRHADVGGNWTENRYPGCGVDTPSYLYSMSYFRRDWSTQFARRAEVEGYLGDLVDALDLRRHIRFETSVERAEYNEAARVWEITLTQADGSTERLSARAVISAVGVFNQPVEVEITGSDLFDGQILHTATWPDGADLADKRVAVIGTGASAMQVVPSISGVVKDLTVFQRTPQWVAPNEFYYDAVMPGVHWLMTNVPYYYEWYRFRLAWTFNDKTHASLQIDPAWPDSDRSLNAINDAHRRYFTSYLEQELEGRPDLVEKSLPRYPPFGKRILLDNGWFAALRRPNVHLVADSVEAFTRSGLRDRSGNDYEVDTVVLATGFAARRFLGTLEVLGSRGNTLRDIWGDDDATAYLGITVPGFPNFFLAFGPNTVPGAGGSVVFTVECQVHYIVSMIRRMAEEGISTVECRQDFHDAYMATVDDAHSKMVWSHPGMNPYARNASGRVVTNSPWRVVDYWEMTRQPSLQPYIVERMKTDERVPR